MFSTWAKLSQSCTLFQLNYGFNMAPMTSHGNGDGGWRMGWMLCSQSTFFLPTLSCHSPSYQQNKPGPRIFHWSENYPQTDVWSRHWVLIWTCFCYQQHIFPTSHYTGWNQWASGVASVRMGPGASASVVWKEGDGPHRPHRMRGDLQRASWGKLRCKCLKDKMQRTRWEATRQKAEVLSHRKASLRKRCPSGGTAWRPSKERRGASFTSPTETCLRPVCKSPHVGRRAFLQASS